MKPALSHKRNAIDRHVRVVFSAAGQVKGDLSDSCVRSVATGPFYARADAVAALQARRAGELHYTHCFAEKLFREMLFNSGKACVSQREHPHDFVSNCCCLSELTFPAGAHCVDPNDS